jgi:hypothetical protein
LIRSCHQFFAASPPDVPQAAAALPGLALFFFWAAPLRFGIM